MSKQPEALNIADQLQAAYPSVYVGLAPSAAAELRRLHEANAELLEALVDVMFRHVPFSNKSDYAERARAAIAKHGGQ